MPITVGYDTFIANAKGAPHYSALLLACYNAVQAARADAGTSAGELKWIRDHFNTEQGVADTLMWFIPFIICQSGALVWEGKIADQDIGAVASVVRQTIGEVVSSDDKIKAAGL